ncbi:MAG TPA: hypothetical protein VGO85_13810 [Caldimonas sp.]|nr:hypothetical protein [Caldimonas sp.]
MDAADAFWHLTNFFAPALFLGAFAAALTKAIWRRELGPGRGLRLWAWASGAAALASIAGLAIFGHDGRIATYAAMVVACAAALWWAGFRGAKR